MKIISSKAPVRTKSIKCAMFGLMTAAAIAGAKTNVYAAEVEPNEQATQTQTQTQTSRYVYSTFGEGLDTKYCVSEAEMEEITEAVCRENSFEYVTPELLESVAYQEGRFVADAKNGTAISMYQFKPEFHEESISLANIDTELLEWDALSQTKVAANILEMYAEDHASDGLTKEEIVKAALADYHLTLSSASEMISNKAWDSYILSVTDRAQMIKLNKHNGMSARDVASLDNSEDRTL